MKAKSITCKSVAGLESALAETIYADFKPTLAIVFMSVKQDREAVMTLLRADGIAVFGATTGGEFVDGDLGSGTIAILFLDLAPSRFRILLEDYAGKDAAAVASEMTRKGMEVFPHPAYILSYGFHVDTGIGLAERIIRSVSDTAGPQVSVWGGGAGDDMAYKATWVFDDRRASDQGIIMLVLDEDHVVVRGSSLTGHLAVGTEKTVTRAVDNWIYTIDGQPAADMVLRYLGINMTPEELESFNPGVIVLSVSRPEGEAVFRSSAVFNWMDKSILVSSGIREGDKIRLTLPPDFEAIGETARRAREIRDTVMPEADAVLMFSCIGRLGAFGPLTGEEVAGIKDVFRVPMAGFFSYGEFGRATGGQNEVHNMTCCWVALKEMPDPLINNDQ